MRLKVSFAKEVEHKDSVSCVCWYSPEEILSCGDDHLLLKWNVVTGEAVKLCQLSSDVYPTDLHSFSRNVAGGKRHGQEQLLITSTDGKFQLLGRNGRLEKSVEAHKGAALVGRWSYDGASLLTGQLNTVVGGEDGACRVWSRSGMARSVVAQTSAPVYTAAWSPDDSSVLLATGNALLIRPLAPNTKPNRWKAHDGLILKVAWSPSSNLIVSGSEDCRYKVWDGYGRQLYGSAAGDWPITALAWAPSGDAFAVGAFDTLRLCDKTGWSQCLEKPASGSVHSVAWSPDGSQLAAACASPHVMLAHVIDRRSEWQQLEAVQTSRKSVCVRDVTTEARDRLEFAERVVHVGLGFGRLVVVTATQCHIYAQANLNTPVIAELREGAVTLLLLADKQLLLVERGGVTSVLSYEGRLLAAPRWPNLQPDSLNAAHVSLSPDYVALRDHLDHKQVQLCEVGGGGALSAPFTHSAPIEELALNQTGDVTERRLALVDRNRDLWVVCVQQRPTLQPAPRKIGKLGMMVQSVCWNARLNVLSAMQDTALTVWYYPEALFVDPRLIRHTVVVKDGSEFGRSPRVSRFAGCHVGVRRSDGALVNSLVCPRVVCLHGLAAANKWAGCLRLCRAAKDETVWAVLAGLAVRARDLDTAEQAYAAIDQPDRVHFIQYIKGLPLRAVQLAHVSLLGANADDAESVLLQSGLAFRAIMVNVSAHQWHRALDLAVKQKTHVDTVLWHRQKYLRSFGQTETDDKFLRFDDQVELDEEKIQKKIALEYEKEKSRAS